MEKPDDGTKTVLENPVVQIVLALPAIYFILSLFGMKPESLDEGFRAIVIIILSLWAIGAVSRKIEEKISMVKSLINDIKDIKKLKEDIEILKKNSDLYKLQEFTVKLRNEGGVQHEK